MPVALCIGAGAVSRSLIAPTLGEAGYRIVFADPREHLVRALSKAREYTICFHGGGDGTEFVSIQDVDAISLYDAPVLRRAIGSADLITVSIGPWAIDQVVPLLVAGLRDRTTKIDFIVAENAPDSSARIAAHLSHFGLTSEKAGVVRASVDRISPPRCSNATLQDTLSVCAEPYSEFVVDASAIGPSLLAIPSVIISTEIDAYAQRKLFVVNLGHAAIAYLGSALDSDVELGHEAAELAGVGEGAFQAMTQSAAGVVSEHPVTFTTADMHDYVADSFARITSVYLADTVLRLGRDVRRKLGRSERIVGAMRLADRHGHPYDAIVRVARAALRFDDRERRSAHEPLDSTAQNLVARHGARAAFRILSGLSESDPIDRRVLEVVMANPDFR